MSRLLPAQSVWACLTGLLLASAAAGQVVTVNTVDSLRNELTNAAPGKIILVASGNYPARLWADNVNGTAASPIKILAKDPANRPVFDTTQSGVFTLNNCSYIQVDGIIAQGAGTATSGGNGIEAPNSDHIIFANCVGRNLTNQGNSDAYKFANSQDILMYNCRVENWAAGGSGVDGMVSTGNLYMRNTITYPTLPDGAAANGIMPKGGATNSGLYKNTFIDGSSRPVQFGGGSAYTGPQASNMVAMGNVIVAGETAVAYCSSTLCEFAYNTVVNPEKWVMRVLTESAFVTSSNTFRRNLVQYGNVSTVQNIGANTRADTFTYAEDYWYKTTNPAGSIPTLAAPEPGATGGVNPQLDADYRPLYAGARAYGAHAPAMEAEFAAHAGWFQWAWDQAQVLDPRAQAGGSYHCWIGSGVTFSSTGSYAGATPYTGVGGVPLYNNTITSRTWDINNDNVFTDASGATISLTSGTLLNQFGLQPGTHNVQLRIAVQTIGGVIVDWDTAQLTLEAYPGDATWDGTVNVQDLAVLAVNYNLGSKGWQQGDFTGDGTVDVQDLAILALQYNQGIPPSAPVPEPLTVLALLIAWPMVRRRRATRRPGDAGP